MIKVIAVHLFFLEFSTTRIITNNKSIKSSHPFFFTTPNPTTIQILQSALQALNDLLITVQPNTPNRNLVIRTINQLINSLPTASLNQISALFQFLFQSLSSLISCSNISHPLLQQTFNLILQGILNSSLLSNIGIPGPTGATGPRGFPHLEALRVLKVCKVFRGRKNQNNGRASRCARDSGMEGAGIMEWPQGVQGIQGPEGTTTLKDFKAYKGFKGLPTTPTGSGWNGNPTPPPTLGLRVSKELATGRDGRAHWPSGCTRNSRPEDQKEPLDFRVCQEFKGRKDHRTYWASRCARDSHRNNQHHGPTGDCDCPPGPTG